MKIVDILRKVSSFRKCGICNACYQLCHELDYPPSAARQLRTIMKQACEDWEHYSGDKEFPVSHPTLDPINGYYEDSRNVALWEGEYGRRRMELLNRMIAIAETLE